MKIHIIHHDEDHIVPRMAKWLAEYYGWSVGYWSDIDCDVCLFMPYTRYFPTHAEKTAAWFTHYENSHPGKRRQWHDVAGKVDVRLYTSDVYRDDLESFGPSVKIRAGVDVDLFKPGKKDTNGRTIGVVGIGQVRKNPGLLDELHNYDLRIAGRGNWHGHLATWYEYEDMPQFYNSIDVLLVTGTEEGIPAPPLEAMACNTKVVIPCGVGIMDELPEMPGIRHYGSPAGMLYAIELCLSDGNVSLRDIVIERYTREHWCESFCGLI